MQKLSGRTGKREMIQNDKIVLPDYLKFVKRKPCVVLHVHDGPLDVHHLRAVHWRESDRNDFTGVPLCRAAHTEIEQIGERMFQETYKINLWKEAFYLFLEYAVKKEWIKVHEK